MDRLRLTDGRIRVRFGLLQIITKSHLYRRRWRSLYALCGRKGCAFLVFLKRATCARIGMKCRLSLAVRSTEVRALCYLVLSGAGYQPSNGPIFSTNSFAMA